MVVACFRLDSRLGLRVRHSQFPTPRTSLMFTRPPHVWKPWSDCALTSLDSVRRGWGRYVCGTVEHPPTVENPAYNTANLYAYDLGSNSWSRLRPGFLRLASLLTLSMPRLLAACVAPVAVAAATGPFPASVVSPGYGVAGGKVYWFGGRGPGAGPGDFLDPITAL
eukprot:150973-Rhodomonas_salina.2